MALALPPLLLDPLFRYLSNRIEREEGGTPDIVGAVRAGLSFHVKSLVGDARIEDLEHRLASRVFSSLSTNPLIDVLGAGSTAERLPIVSFMVRCGHLEGEGGPLYLHYNFVAAVLNDVYGIQARGGCQCAGPYSQVLLGMDGASTEAFEQALLVDREYLRPGFVRLNFVWFMSPGEVEFILAAIHQVCPVCY